MRVVTLSWPADPDRGSETYGPFATTADAERWVDACEEAAADGYPLLKGAHYLLHSAIPPFDPTALWEQTV